MPTLKIAPNRERQSMLGEMGHFWASDQ